ncbi:MAG TPA: ATP-binding protein [Pyrinomonadaceae bacterium]
MPALDSNPQPKQTVLIVDGDSQAPQQLAFSFQEAGFRALTAANAAAALHLLGDEQCDLAILSLDKAESMALCRLLRAQPRTSNVPVIVLGKNDADRAEVLAAGVDDYFAANLNPAELVARAGSLLRAAQREWALTGSNRELRFLADLGRGLLRALEPDQLVRRLAGATYEGTAATLCGAYVKLDEKTEAGCVFDREGSAEDISLMHLDRLNAWLSSPSGTVPLLATEPHQLFLDDDVHAVEYVAPLRFGGRTKGALIVAFDNREGCGETECRLADAAAQQASLAAQISSLYQAARESSLTLAEEVDRRTLEADAQRRFTEAIIDSLPVSLYAVDRHYRVVAWNRNRELGELGIPRGVALGRNIFSVLTRQRRDVLEDEFSRVFESGAIERIEQETVTVNGETKHWLISKIPMWIDNSGEVSHVITVGEEITARVEANRAVARAEKLAAVGRLASGVVHEINNPLATISACAEALESRVTEGAFDSSPEVDDLREYLGLIRSEAFRCKTITNGLLDFSRTRAAQHVPLNVEDVISTAARLLSHQSRGENINIQIHAGSDLQPVLGDAGQLQQAVIALATNAVDAMPFGGMLKISARNEGNHVLVEVSDNGIGIPSENLARIFEPFFTTKELGRGTGLGLAVCYGILTEHGGSLDVQSTVGVGTTFTISLPAANQNGDLAG